MTGRDLIKKLRPHAIAATAIAAMPSNAQAQVSEFFGKEGFTEIASNGVALFLFLLQLVVFIGAGTIVVNLIFNDNGVNIKKIIAVIVAAGILIALPEFWTYIQENSASISFD